MMTDFRYRLEKYKGPKTRHTCPSCQGKKTYVLYLDQVTGEPLHSRVGKCERLNNCGYHYTPKQYYTDNGITPPLDITGIDKAEAFKETSFIDKQIFMSSLKGYDTNNFILYLSALFDPQTVSGLVRKYFIGTSKFWPGATVFWQIDLTGKVRTGKIMLYNPGTGKRVKDHHRSFVNWAHVALKRKDYNLKQCLFGEHLLKTCNGPIAIVESEKTAIIASAYLPKFTWLACGGLQYLNRERCNPLRGRKVILYPDLNAFDKWKEKAQEMNFEVSDLLESRATEDERRQGLDIADYLTQFKFN